MRLSIVALFMALSSFAYAEDSLIGGWTCFGKYQQPDGSLMTLITNENFLADQHHSFGEVVFDIARFEVQIEHSLLLTNSWQRQDDQLIVTIDRSFILGDSQPRYEQVANLEGIFAAGNQQVFNITRIDRKHMDLVSPDGLAEVSCDRKRQIILD